MAAGRRHRAGVLRRRPAGAGCGWASRPSTFTETSGGSSGAGRRCAAGAHHRPVAEHRLRFLRRHYFEAGERGGGELDAALRGRGLMYRSPIVRMRQMLDLYTCLRPCRAFAESAELPRRISTWWCFAKTPKECISGWSFRGFRSRLSERAGDGLGFRRMRRSRSAASRLEASERIVRAAFEYAVRTAGAR